MADIGNPKFYPPAPPIESAATLEDAPTESHALATADLEPEEEVGFAQMDHNEANAKDLGWNNHPDDIPDPLVGGLSNQQLWLLIRRFNMVSSDKTRNRVSSSSNDHTNSSAASIPCQGFARGSARRPRPQRRRERRLLSTEDAKQHRTAVHLRRDWHDGPVQAHGSTELME